MKAAPYMNHPLPIMIPIYKWWEVPYMWIGAKASAGYRFLWLLSDGCTQTRL